VTTVLLIQPSTTGAPPLEADLAAAGFLVNGPHSCAQLVREALRGTPDAVVCWEPRPGADLFEAVRALHAQQPTPVLVFTQDASVETMSQALDAGVHGWVVQGYGRERLRSVVHLAQARERHETALRGSLADLRQRFDERKLIDRAKGILMRSRRLSEDDAFQLLRSASMHGNQRVGQVSRQVIDAAETAEAINRAGQQRMLSQRLVKLYALACLRTEAAASALLMRQSAERVDDNLAALGKLSEATFGDLVGQARAGWAPLRALVMAPPQAARLGEVDTLAEAMLAQADTFVHALEGAGLARTVGVVNVAGRQRMLSQRMAKQALFSADGLEPTALAFEDGLRTLEQSPLSTPEIRAGLEAARAAWERLRAGARRAGDAAGRVEVAAASEELLDLFDRLTESYQHSIEVLMG
jgi:AmiR/NasT family two-component response regulator